MLANQIEIHLQPALQHLRLPFEALLDIGLQQDHRQGLP